MDPLDALDSTAISKLMVKVGLVNESQIQEAWMDIGQKTTAAEPLLNALERKGYLTPYQSSKLRKGDPDGYFLGGYRLLYKIASGSFGRVYRAEEPMTGRVVAIKVLRRRWSEDQHIIDLFEREGKLGLSLRHPNIVEILAVNQDTVTKQYYIVMEFVEGGNLREILRARPGYKVEPQEGVRIIEEALTGMAHAYSRGVTHRDMKLTNILISSTGTAKLVDFGLAGIFARKGLELDNNERVDRTVDYAGLEKATNVKQGDVRSDLYFLGCVLYEMLTGRSPLLMTKDPRARSSKQRFDSVPPIRKDELNAPPSLIQYIERLMSLDPALRFQTPSQALEGLKAVRRDIESGVQGGEARPVARTVFIVEKDERLQDMMRDRFKELGYRVLLSTDPNRALERFRQQPYDALILDAGATDEEGWFSFEKILDEGLRNEQPCAGILILNENQKPWADKTTKRPNQAILIRPITLKNVTRTLAQFVPPPAKAKKEENAEAAQQAK